MAQREVITSRLRILPVGLKDLRQGFRGEITYDYEKDTLRLYNGEDRGGFELLRADLSNIGGGSTSLTLGTITALTAFQGKLITNQTQGIDFNNLAGLATRLSVDATNFKIQSTANVQSIRIENSTGLGKLEITQSGNIDIQATDKVTIEGISFKGTEIDTTDSTTLNIVPVANFRSNITFAGTLLPAITNTVSLGSSSKKFTKAWIGTGGIDIDSAQLLKAASGKIFSSTGFETAIGFDVSGGINIRETTYNGTTVTGNTFLSTSSAATSGGAGQLIIQTSNPLSVDRRYALVPAVNNQYTSGSPSFRWKATYTTEVKYNDGTTQTTAPETNPLVSTKVYTNRKATALAIALGG